MRFGTEILKVRTVFKYGFEAGLLDRPVRYGPQVNKPSAGVRRRHRAKVGEKMLEAPEVRRLVDAAPGPLRATILLGFDAGFGILDTPPPSIGPAKVQELLGARTLARDDWHAVK